MNFPCKDCPDRHPKCHAKCEKYNSIKEENRRIKEQEFRRNESEHAVNEIRDRKFKKLGHR